MKNSLRGLLLVGLVRALAGCTQQPDVSETGVPDTAASDDFQAPPAEGLEENPARPRSERPAPAPDDGASQVPALGGLSYV